MNRSCVSVIFCFGIVLGMCSGAHAGASFEIIPGAGYFTGYTKFQIGNVPKEDDFVTPPREPYFPISELKFPLMSGMATIDGKAAFGPVTLEGGVKQNFTHDTGMMRDYDWGMPYYDPAGPSGAGWYVQGWTDGQEVWYDIDTESKSKTHMDAVIWSAKASCKVYTYDYETYDKDWSTGKVSHNKGTVSVSLGLGYEKRHFDFETSLVKQWSPTGHNDVYYVEGDGSVTETYKVDYSIPFIELSVAERTEKLLFDMVFGASTLVHVDDEDVHLVREPGPIYSTGSLTGTALKFTTHVQYDFTPNWFAGVAWDFISLRASGTQHQHTAAGPTWDASDYSIDEKVLSLQSLFSLNVGFRFGTR
jgi:hypothetical protein